ncbi:GIY-YIG nuclease family protein [Candidatus Curtissbacteria bacterium]|nr:GIY-YIG nuclease family protein [Candidatus Curtissbacteria bacterium]
MTKAMYVYIMVNSRPTLYTGVTNDLIRRVYEHKNEMVSGFTKKYHLHKLLYYEKLEGQLQAIIREKQIKDMNRSDKLEMIKKSNPLFEDLYSNIVDSGQARMTKPTNIILGIRRKPETPESDKKDSGQALDPDLRARMTGGAGNE